MSVDATIELAHQILDARLEGALDSATFNVFDDLYDILTAFTE